MALSSPGVSGESGTTGQARFLGTSKVLKAAYGCENMVTRPGKHTKNDGKSPCYQWVNPRTKFLNHHAINSYVTNYEFCMDLMQ